MQTDCANEMIGDIVPSCSALLSIVADRCIHFAELLLPEPRSVICSGRLDSGCKSTGVFEGRSSRCRVGYSRRLVGVPVNGYLQARGKIYCSALAGLRICQADDSPRRRVMGTNRGSAFLRSFSTLPTAASLPNRASEPPRTPRESMIFSTSTLDCNIASAGTMSSTKTTQTCFCCTENPNVPKQGS